MRISSSAPENWLLTLSGILATGLAALVCITNYAPLPNILIHGVFVAVFFAQSFSNELRLPEPIAKFCILLMLLLSYGVIWLNNDTVSLILAVVLMASAPHHLSPAKSWLLLGLANLGYAIIFDSSGRDTNSWSYTLLTMMALQLFALTSSLAKQREVVAQEQLASRNSELLAARALIANQSQADERLRIAGELHDTVGHGLTALQLQLEVLAHETPPEHKTQVKSCQTLAHRLLNDIRLIVRSMSQKEREDLASTVRELDALTPGVSVQFSGEAPALEPELARQLIFCFQEAVNNAIRHGGATLISIACHDGAFHIDDNGSGSKGKSTSAGFGLNNINTRLEPFGGHGTIGPSKSLSGCELVLHLQSETSAQ